MLCVVFQQTGQGNPRCVSEVLCRSVLRLPILPDNHPYSPGARHHVSQGLLSLFLSSVSTSHDPLQLTNVALQGISPGQRDDMPPSSPSPAADGCSTVAYRFAASQAIMDPEIAADLRPSADRSAVRTALVAGSG